jgi:RimJ/RimL family protein N-acetyltransferase
VQIGRDEKLKRIVATIKCDNFVMQHVSRNIGFTLTRVESEFHAELNLSKP